MATESHAPVSAQDIGFPQLRLLPNGVPTFTMPLDAKIPGLPADTALLLQSFLANAGLGGGMQGGTGQGLHTGHRDELTPPRERDSSEPRKRGGRRTTTVSDSGTQLLFCACVCVSLCVRVAFSVHLVE